MGKVYCPCGWIISTILDPCPDKYFFITDRSLQLAVDKMIKIESEGIVDPDDFLIELEIQIVDNSTEAYKCPKCNRIAIVDNNFKLHWYDAKKNSS